MFVLHGAFPAPALALGGETGTVRPAAAKLARTVKFVNHGREKTMIRFSLLTAVAVLLSWAPQASAQSPGYYRPQSGGAVPVSYIDHNHGHGTAYDRQFVPLNGYPPAMGAAPQFMPSYPDLNAPMYPSPQPNVPYQVGATMITNQAFAPHELLHEHKYKALYPPFYYKVKGGWMVTPFGVWSHDHWELQGTKVEVEYKSRFGLLSGFVPPK